MKPNRNYAVYEKTNGVEDVIAWNASKEVAKRYLHEQYAHYYEDPSVKSMNFTEDHMSAFVEFNDGTRYEWSVKTYKQ